MLNLLYETYGAHLKFLTKVLHVLNKPILKQSEHVY